MMIVEAPWPQPTSATFAPRSSFSTTPLERGHPFGDQVGPVAGAEEPLRAAEEAVVVLVPAHSLAGAERLQDPVLVRVEGRDQLERTEDVDGAVLVGERERLLVRAACRCPSRRRS